MPSSSTASQTSERRSTAYAQTPHYSNDPRAVARAFDQDSSGYAESYAQLDMPAASFYLGRQAIVMKALRPIESGLILDIGCGPGIYAKPCFDRGLHYYGLDISPRMIDEARSRFGHLANIEYAVGDARRLPLPTDHVDGLLCLGMLEYVNQEDEQDYINEMIRVLKPGGIIVFSFLSKGGLFWKLRDQILPIINNYLIKIKNKSRYVGDGEDINARKFEQQERIKTITKCGLQATKVVYFASSLIPSPLDRRYPRLTLWLSSRSERLLRWRLFRSLALAFVIVARKPSD